MPFKHWQALHNLVVSKWAFPPTALRRRHTQMVRHSSSSYKIDYGIGIKNFLNSEGHQNHISGSKVTTILLKGWIWPIGGVASGRVCGCSLPACFLIIYICFCPDCCLGCGAHLYRHICVCTCKRSLLILCSFVKLQYWSLVVRYEWLCMWK